MTKYVAFLRGINVGGKNIIKMVALKSVFQKNGFEKVSTYIQSGNVIFESEETNIQKLTQEIEMLLSKTFHYESRVIVRSYTQMKQVIAEVPVEWKRRHDLRSYIVFIREPVSEIHVLKEIEPKKGVDFVKKGAGVLYISTLLSGLTKSGFTKLVGKKIYQDITIRNYNTTQKIAMLMVKMEE